METWWRRERASLALIVLVGVAVRVAYALAVSGDLALRGDQIGYEATGVLAAQGHWLWGTDPSGIPHPTFWKPPGYGVWVGLWYTVLGHHTAALRLVQAVICGPATILLTWLLARRLTGSARASLLAAAIVAVSPAVFQYEELVYSEALAIPVTTAILLAGLDRVPTPRRAALVGLLTGAGLLIRPTAFIALAGVLAAWLVVAGLRRGLGHAAIAAVCAAVVVAPWTVRNHHVSGAFVPISVQDGALAGTFNPTSANDPDHPYAWRPPFYPRDRDLFQHDPPLPEATILDELRTRAFDYIRDHPASVPQAFYFNGVVRLWSLRPPGGVMREAQLEGGYRGVALVALLAYWVLAAAALVTLWRWRRTRTHLVVAVAVIVAVASVAFVPASGARYRATLEPLIAVLACAGFSGARRRAPAAPAAGSAAAPSAPPAPAVPG